MQAQQSSAPQIYQEPNNGPTLIFYGNVPNGNPNFNPNIPQQPTPGQRTLIIHNPSIPDPNQSPSYPPDAPKPDISNVKGPPAFTFNPNVGAPYTPNNPDQAVPPPPPGSPVFNPNHMIPRPIPRPGPGTGTMPNANPNPADPQMPPPPKGPFSRPLPKHPTTPGIVEQQNQPELGPIVNAQNAEHEVYIQHGPVDRNTFIFSVQAQIVIGTLAAFIGLCFLIRCYSKCCWDRPKSGGDEYLGGTAVSRENTSIEDDIDWSDHTENEDDPLDDDNCMTDVQQMKSRKARELIPDDSIESGIYSNVDERLDLVDAGGDVEILMEEDGDEVNGNKEYPLTDDETRAIMREFKDTDDEYVD